MTLTTDGGIATIIPIHFAFGISFRKGFHLDILPKKQPRSRADVTQLTLASGTSKRIAAPKKPTRSYKKLLVRSGFVFVNCLVIGVVGYIVLAHSSNASYGVHNLAAKDGSNPLDALSAADVAVNIARMANLSEVTAVTNYADTMNAELASFTVDKEVAQIPQIVSGNIKTMADVQEYTTQPGDTISALAAKFAVTSDSIKWSNDLLNDTLDPGVSLLIPPMNGVLYIVRSGDTPEKIAQTYQASAEQITVFNDAEIAGLPVGKRIFIPNGQKPAPVFFSFSRFGNNGYDPGWCTYYAAAEAGAPPGWGHARTWALNATRTPGWMVSKVPVPGAIAQTTGNATEAIGRSWGHVGVVDEVKYENGQYYIKYSDMNGIAGFNRVGSSSWVPALEKFQNFIYRIQ